MADDFADLGAVPAEPVAPAQGGANPFADLGAIPVDEAAAPPSDPNLVDVAYDDGSVASLSRDDAAIARATGARLASEVAAERQEAELQAEYGGLGGQIAAGTQGALRGLTLGLSDVASSGITGLAHAATGGGDAPTLTPEARQRMAQLGMEAPPDPGSAFAQGYEAAQAYQEAVRQANQGTALAGELGGAALGASLSGGALLAPGTGAGAALARGVAAPARIVEGLGSAAAARAGTSALARGAAAGAVEGGLAGLMLGATSLSPEQIQDPLLAGEHIAVSGLGGLILGGAGGAALGGAADALRVGGRALGKLGKTIEPPEPTRMPQPDSQDYASVAENLRSRAPSSAALPEPPRGKYQQLIDAVQAASGGLDDAIAEATPAIRADLDTLLSATDNIDEFGGIAQKKAVNRLLTRADVGVDAPAISAVFDDLAAQMDGFVEGMGETALSYDGGLANIRKLRKLLDENKQLALSAFARGEPGEAFALIDQTKRTMGKAAKGLRNQPAQEMLRGLFPRVRSFLEDARLWGQAADKQKAVNPFWSESITRSRDSAVRRFTTRAGTKSVNEWDDMFRADDTAIMNFLRGELGTPGLVANEEAWRTYLRAVAEDATARTNAWGTEALRGEAVKATNAVKRIFDALDAVALKKRDALRGGAMLGQSAAEAVLGAAPGGARVAGAMGGAKRAGFAMASAGRGVASRVAKAADGILSKASASLGKAATSVGIPASKIVRDRMSDREYRQALEESVSLTDAGSPDTEQVIRAAAELEREDPDVADAYATATIKRAEYIASKLPKPDPVAIYAPSPMLDPVTERSVRRTVDAAYRPVDALERVAKLVHSPEDLEAIKTLYPAMWADFQRRLEARMRDSSKRPNWRTRQAIAVSTGLPLDPVMDPGRLAKAQQAAAAPMVQEETGPQQGDVMAPAAGGRPPRFGGRSRRDDVYASQVDRILDQR